MKTLIQLVIVGGAAYLGYDVYKKSQEKKRAASKEVNTLVAAEMQEEGEEGAAAVMEAAQVQQGNQFSGAEGEIKYPIRSKKASDIHNYNANGGWDSSLIDSGI